MYAIVESGGKQYKVSKGDVIRLEKLNAEPGAEIKLEQVLAVGEGEELKFGKPYVKKASVRAKVLEHGKGKKIIVFKYRAKKNYRRKQGHRQPFTKVAIEDISVDK